MNPCYYGFCIGATMFCLTYFSQSVPENSRLWAKSVTVAAMRWLGAWCGQISVWFVGFISIKKSLLKLLEWKGNKCPVVNLSLWKVFECVEGGGKQRSQLVQVFVFTASWEWGTSICWWARPISSVENYILMPEVGVYVFEFQPSHECMNLQGGLFSVRNYILQCFGRFQCDGYLFRDCEDCAPFLFLF